MDLPHITSYLLPKTPDEIHVWEKGQAWLAGGTWLYSEPQPELHTLVDMQHFDWPALQISGEGLEIAATCKIAELDAFTAPDTWKAAPLIRECCHALQSSFKIWNEATVGGNLCLSLPAASLVALAAALEGTCLLWSRTGGRRTVAVADFVTGNRQNVLAPGELLRSIHLPVSALQKRHALRRFSLTQEGRSSVLLIGTLGAVSSEFILTVTAATLRPVQIRFAQPPSATALLAELDSHIPEALYLDDAHGTPAHRQHLTRYFAPQILDELMGTPVQQA